MSNFKRILIISLLGVLFVFKLVISQVPSTINYQGILTDASGQIVPDGNYNLGFKLYDVPTGGTSLWLESQMVPVSKGIFNVILGSVNSINLDFDKKYWLGITINGNVELTPRIELTSSAYSMNVKRVKGATIENSTINSTPIGEAAPSTGNFTKLKVNEVEITEFSTDGNFSNSDVSLPTENAVKKYTEENFLKNGAAATFASVKIGNVTINKFSTDGNLGTSDEALPTEKAIRAYIDKMIPPGTIMAYGGTTAPGGWLLCDGSEYLISDKKDLYDVIKNSFGSRTTGVFNVPDFRGVFLRGKDREDDVNKLRDPDANSRIASNIGGLTGNKVGSLQSDSIKSHTHIIPLVRTANPTDGLHIPRGITSTNTTESTNPFGGSETRPKNIYVNYIIKY